MLLAKTLRSSTFRLALIAIAAFGLIVAAIMAYVYFGTIAYVQGRVGDAGDHSGFTAMIELAMVAVAVLLAVLAGVAAVLVTRRTVGRIEEINATSRAIMLSGLDRRIPLRGSHDEWDRVAENLNQMLDRIETLMGEVKQVSDNVAHDLRTPLTRMRGRLEKAYHTPRNGEADATLIGDTIADLDAVLGMFASITRISEIETRARRSAFRTLSLTEIAGEVVELYDAAAEQVATRLSHLTATARLRLRGTATCCSTPSPISSTTRSSTAARAGRSP
ncbi:signal transduction histidine kinase [Bradyrhizobium sp. i1.7.7]